MRSPRDVVQRRSTRGSANGVISFVSHNSQLIQFQFQYVTKTCCSPACFFFYPVGLGANGVRPVTSTHWSPQKKPETKGIQKT